MKKVINPILITNFLFFCAIVFSTAQPSIIMSKETPEIVNEKERQEVVESVSQLLNDNYVFPEVAKKMTTLLKDKLKAGKYDAIELPNEFAQQLTTDLQSISEDKHLRVGFSPERIAQMKAMSGGAAEQEARRLQQMKNNNFGFQEVKILEGNIGYLNLTGFMDTQFGGETAVAAMNFLSNSKALIIDLRNNGGGSPSMIQLITSYLYDSEPVHLNNFYWRPDDRTTQTWTLPHVSGQRRPDMDVYVLTSGGTFSAAEEFSYNLKHLKRATLVGETTGGGAHPGGTQIATDRFTVWVPSGRAINPITNTNWEGTGVKPHFEVPQQDALITAHLKALETLAEQAKTPEEKAQIEWGLAPLRAKVKPIEISDATLQSYVGQYGPRILSYEDGRLFYQREGRPKHELTALAEDWFMFEAAPYFRLKIVKDDDKVVAVEGFYDNGHRDRNERTAAKP